jgi:hypothetical protein
MVGSDVRFSMELNFWLPVLVAGLVSAGVVYPFRGVRLWVAAVAGVASGLILFALNFFWLDL